MESKFLLAFVLLSILVNRSMSQVRNANSFAPEINLIGCTLLPTAPEASTLKCTPSLCTATCAPKYKFPKGETVLTSQCVHDKWVIQSPKYKDHKELPACQPTCNPACANNGKCIAPNRCQCSQNFQGPTCREKACHAPPPPAQNTKRTCRPSECTVECLPGHKYKNSATVMKLQCRNGNWVSVTRNLPLNSHCEPHCWKKCQNGGKCVSPNQCQCPDKFRGPQCQHSTDRCAASKIGFNGNVQCLGSENEMSCSLKCPDGVPFEFPPSSFYKCKFADGVFTPTRVPKCVYGEGVQVVQRNQLEAAPSRLQSPSNRGPTCSPSCMNGGSCISHNVCQCPQNFAGSYCQHSVDRCSPKKIGFNGGFRCSGTSSGMSCTLNCPPGINFEFPPAAAYTCNFDTGMFTPSRVPKCVYGEGMQVVHSQSRFAGGDDQPSGISCNQPCLNGGTCIFHNMCQCPKNFRGAQCQYSVDRCSIRNTGFNGGFRCSGSANEMTCTLNCPEDVDFEFTPAPSYTCSYDIGRFSPSPIPKCVYGEGVEIIRRTTSN